MIFLGFGKYVRGDKIYALEPLGPGERGHGARTKVWVEGIPDPIVASRTERAIIAAMGGTPGAENRIVDEALDLAQRVAEAAEQGRFDVGDLGRRARRLLEASANFDWSLPEVFAGFTRAETPFPIAYPTAARPQAWAAGTPVLLLRLLLGLEPDIERQALVSLASPDLPSWVGELSVSGIRAFGRSWRARVEDGGVVVEEER